MSAVKSYKVLFDHFAPYYYITEIASWGMAQRLRKRAAALAGLQKDSVVVDLMCGTGNNIPIIKKATATSFQYTGIDVSETMIAMCKQKYAGHKKIAFIQEDILQIQKLPLKASHIFCTFGLKCIEKENYSPFADVINNMLAADGTLVMADFQEPENKYFAWLFRAYINTFYSFLCIVFSGSAAPAKALIKSVYRPIDFDCLNAIFRERGFCTYTEKSVNGTFVLFTCKKQMSN